MTTDSLELRLVELQSQITLNQRLYEQQHESERRATEAALGALTTKLMTMNDVRGALSDQTRAMIPRVEVAAAIDALKERGDASRDALWKRVESVIQPLDTKIDELHRPNVQLLISLAVLGMTLFGGLWVVLGLQISDHATPLALAIEQIKTEDTAFRSQIAQTTAFRERQLHDIELRLGTHDTENAATAQKLVETEDRFRAISTVINLMKDDNHQMIGVFWQKLFGTTLPPKNYHSEMFPGKSP